MADTQDQLDISWQTQVNEATVRDRANRPWLSVYFQCCHVYTRIYRNQAATAYNGACPRCGKRVRARVGPGGTSQRCFRAG